MIIKEILICDASPLHTNAYKSASSLLDTMYYNYLLFSPAEVTLSHSLQNKRAQYMKMSFLHNIIIFQSPFVRTRKTSDENLMMNGA